MAISLSEITEEALALPSEARAFLAEKLLETLDFEEDFPIDAAWLSEVQRRCQEIDKGGIETIPADEVLSELRRECA